MAARLTFKDVLEGRAVPQRRDMVGNYLYAGGDPSDLSRYQPQAANGINPPPLTGSIFDPANLAPVSSAATGAAPAAATPYVSGVKLLMPDFPAGGPQSLARADLPPRQGFGDPPSSAAFQADIGAQDHAAHPAKYPRTDSRPPSPQISPAYMRDIDNHLQKSVEDTNAAQLSQLPVPLVNGRMVAGGNYGTYRGTYKGNPYPYDTDPTFNPEVASALTKAIQQMNSEGITPTITAGFRSAEEQQWLRDHPGKYPVDKGLSWHQAGAAVDFNSKIPAKTRVRIVQIMQENGFTPGAQFGDGVHFQYGKRNTNPTLDQVKNVGGD